MDILDYLPTAVTGSWNDTVIETQPEAMEYSETAQKLHGDALTSHSHVQLKDQVSVRINQNDTTELLQVWNSWNSTDREAFTAKYGHITCLLKVTVDASLVRALIQFWDPFYRCFSFDKMDLVPTIEEYNSLLGWSSDYPIETYQHDRRTEPHRALAKLLDMPASSLQTKFATKGSQKFINWIDLKQLSHVLPQKNQRRKLFALAIYGLVVFPRIVGFIEGDIITLFEQICNAQINPTSVILCETIRALNFCRQRGGKFIGCSHLLNIWIKSHLPCEKQHFGNRFSKDFIPIEAFLKSETTHHDSKEAWVNYFRNITELEIEWRAPWSTSTRVVYRCGNCPWVPLLGIWGGTSYAPAQVRKQFGSMQFIPMTHNLSKLEFSHEDPNSNKLAMGISVAWKRIFILKSGPIISPTAYYEWRNNRKEGIVLSEEVIRKLAKRELEKELEEEKEKNKRMLLDMQQLGHKTQLLEEKVEYQKQVISQLVDETDQKEMRVRYWEDQYRFSQDQLQTFLVEVRKVTEQAQLMGEEAKELEELSCPTPSVNVQRMMEFISKARKQYCTLGRFF